MSHKTIVSMAIAAIVLTMLLALSACSRTPDKEKAVDVVESSIAVISHAYAPDSMRRTRFDSSEIPEWLEPTNPAAAVCLSSQGAMQKRFIDVDREATIDAWEKWGLRP